MGQLDMTFLVIHLAFMQVAQLQNLVNKILTAKAILLIHTMIFLKSLKVPFGK